METKDVTLEYVLQPHAISRAVYRLSATARKIIALGMALLPYDLTNLTVSFSVLEYCKSFGIEPSGETYRLLQEAVRECIRAEITIEKDNDWEMFTWISRAWYRNKTNLITLEFSQGLADYILSLKRIYACIDLMDFGKFQSLYAIRYFELAKSYESLAGKNGNRHNCWYFERSIEQLRTILGIEKGIYLKTNDFRRFVIENPIKELNEANLGLKITLEYIRKGRYLVAVRFNCEKIPRKLKNRKKKGVQAVTAPPESPIEDYSLAEKELEHLKRLYPDEYAERYTTLLSNPPNGLMRDNPRLWAGQAARIACQELLEHHGIRK